MQQLSKYDYKRILRKNVSRHFLHLMHQHLKSTKPFLLNIVSLSIYERFAVAYALAQKILQLKEKQKCRVFYVFNQDELEQKLQAAKQGDIFIVGVEELDKYRTLIELKNLNYFILSADNSSNCPYILKVLKETDKTFYCILIKSVPIGTINIKKREIDYNKLLEEIRTPVQKIIANVKHSTEQLLKKMYIPEEIIFMKKKTELRKTENAIIPQKVLIYGDVGTGKSTLLEIFNYLDIKHYGHEHVHSKLHESDLQGLLVRGWSKDPKHWIQTINVEDYTYQGEKDLFTMHAYINLRHTMNERSGGSRADRSSGIQQGIAKCRICLHRLTGDATPTAYRSSFDFQLFLGFPSLKFDRDYIEQIIGPVYVAVLKYLSEQRKKAKEIGNVEEYKKWLGWGIWVAGEEVGLFHLPAEKYPPTPIEILEAPESDETEEVTHWQEWELDLRNEAADHLAFGEVNFNGTKIRINLWGSKKADLPRFDIDMTEIFLLENYPETRELTPRRRRALAKDVFKLAKYLQYSELAPERLENHAKEEKEKERLFKWAQKNWKSIAEKGIEYFSQQESKPTSYEIKTWLAEQWRYRNKAVPKTLNRISFFQMIVDKIQSGIREKYEMSTDSFSDKLLIPPGGIVEKFRSIIQDYKNHTDLYEAIDDLDANLFENKSYDKIADETSRSKSTVSKNIDRAWKRIGWRSWEQAIFTFVFEQVEKIAQEKNYTLLKIVNGNIVDKFPVHGDKDIFAIGVYKHTRSSQDTPHMYATIEKIFKEGFANPPSSPPRAFDFFLSSSFAFLFLWLGGKSTVDFLLFSRSHSRSSSDSVFHFVFDAKSSRRKFKSGLLPLLSHTISHEDLVPQSNYLLSYPECSAAVLFWSLFLGPRYQEQVRPGVSVTINNTSLPLEDQLTKIIQEALMPAEPAEPAEPAKRAKRPPNKKGGKKRFSRGRVSEEEKKG